MRALSMTSREFENESELIPPTQTGSEKYSSGKQNYTKYGIKVDFQ